MCEKLQQRAKWCFFRLSLDVSSVSSARISWPEMHFSGRGDLRRDSGIEGRIWLWVVFTKARFTRQLF